MSMRRRRKWNFIKNISKQPSTQTSSSCSMPFIHSDILHEIFSYLDAEDLSKCIIPVSKEWSNAAKTEVIWHSLFIDRFRYVFRSAVEPRGSSYSLFVFYYKKVYAKDYVKTQPFRWMLWNSYNLGRKVRKCISWAHAFNEKYAAFFNTASHPCIAKDMFDFSFADWAITGLEQLIRESQEQGVLNVFSSWQTFFDLKVALMKIYFSKSIALENLLYLELALSTLEKCKLLIEKVLSNPENRFYDILNQVDHYYIIVSEKLSHINMQLQNFENTINYSDIVIERVDLLFQHHDIEGCLKLQSDIRAVFLEKIRAYLSSLCYKCIALERLKNHCEKKKTFKMIIEALKIIFQHFEEDGDDDELLLDSFCACIILPKDDAQSLKNELQKNGHDPNKILQMPYF